MFLEEGLWIYKESLIEDMRKCRVDVCEEKLLSNLEPLIQVERTRDSLESIGKYIWILMPESDRLTT